MLSKEEKKDFCKKLLYKIVFPDFSNRISWAILGAGIAIILGNNGFCLVIVNWIITNFNANNENRLTLTELQNLGPGYGWGLLCIMLALVHNLLYRAMLVYQDKINADREKSIQLAIAQVNAIRDVESDKRAHADKKEKQNTDKELFKKFISEFGSESKSIYLLKNHNFGAPFYYKDPDEIVNFVEQWGKSENMFLDPEIEAKKSEFWIACSDFWLLLAANSHNILDGTRKCVIPNIYRHGNLPNEILMKYMEINAKASLLYNMHQEFVAFCRQKLNC
ncbi:hypothetical protein ABQ366_15185 [Serratia fonticola]|uniref:hypothetical protein n=1 Tax=Serratia fonticola TaxID=47917 RepID=UPI003AAFFE4D